MKRKKIRMHDAKIFAAEFSGNAPSIDLHGFDTVAAPHELDVFIHSSVLHGEDVIQIIHGRGTGKMRDVVHQFLSVHPFVEVFQDGSSLGEVAGVTYVVLKKRE